MIKKVLFIAVIAILFSFVALHIYLPETYPLPKTVALIKEGTVSLLSGEKKTIIYENLDAGVSFAYPEEWTVYAHPDISPWEFDIFKESPALVRISVPGEVFQGTNGIEAGIDVFVADNAQAYKKCLSPDFYEPTGNIISGENISFVEFTHVGAAAGNRYEVASYRAKNAGKCVVFDAFFHSAVLENYDPSLGVSEFSWDDIHARVKDIVQSFNSSL